MCGIIAYSGHRPAVPILLEGLKSLEYRGYDSAGVAFVQNQKLYIFKASGKLEQLEDKLSKCNVMHSMSGLGHTRWATHGLPTEENAHPHQDNGLRIALVHNGIIENYQILKQKLLDQGYEFSSQTDTEVLVHLIAREINLGNTLPRAISLALSKVEGSFALALINQDKPGEIWAARQSSPLLLGAGTGENFIASDIPAFLAYTRQVVFLDDGELVRIDARGWEVYQAESLEVVEKQVHHIAWDVQAAQKGGYKHFMLKEILEQPQVVSDCLAGRICEQSSQVLLPELEGLPVPDRLHIIACGSSFHAGLWAKYLFEKWAQVAVQVEIASEFRYRDQVMCPGDLALAISQSGETADTLAGMRIARQKKVPVIGLCNVLGSSVSRDADKVMYTQAGPEISVASTKAMCSQMAALLLLALYWGEQKNIVSAADKKSCLEALKSLPQVLNAELPRLRDRAQDLSRKYSGAKSFFFLGRGLNYPLALEGALKLKEISYIHAEGYAAGEMKHGPIALIDPDFPTFALVPEDGLLAKVNSNLREVQARGGRILGLTHPGVQTSVDDHWEVPKLWGPVNSFMVLPALQLFAYEMAVYLGKDVDQPRNLAKSVTVE